MKRSHLPCLLGAALLVLLPHAAHAQAGDETPLLQPQATPVGVRLAGTHRFRVGIVASNSGDFPGGIGRLATLIGDGTVVPVAGGFFWNIAITRSQVDGGALGDERPLMEIEMLTDAHGRVLGQEARIAPKVGQETNARSHGFYLAATALWLERGLSALLPADPVRQGSRLGSLQPAVAGLLAFMAPGAVLRQPPPLLVVAGSRTLQGRATLHAAARGPLTLDTPVGGVNVQQEVRADIAMDSGLPISSEMRLTGDLPGGLGRMDFSVRATLRPF